MIRIKICGLRNVEDALYCTEAGADAIGLVFAESPRQVDLNTARRICESLPPFVSKVGVFVDANKDVVERVAHYCGLTTLQFHGSENASYCRSFALPVIKAIKVKSRNDLQRLEHFPASAFLLDTFHPKLAGGTGKPFDWSMAEKPLPKPIVLAGGLNAGNVAEALICVPAYAVDVSSGVESNGVKDRVKIKAFINAVRRCA
jgi:phosphoribosylanthranilate isomerase